MRANPDSTNRNTLISRKRRERLAKAARPMTAAERKRLQRARDKSNGDVVRMFLTGLIADAKASIADPEEDTPGYLLTHAQTATKLLRVLTDHRNELGLPGTVFTAYGATTPEARERVVTLFELAFARRRAAPDSLIPSSAEAEQAIVAVEWAEAKRVKGGASSADLGTGLRAAKAVVDDRLGQRATSAYSDWAAVKGTLAFNLWLGNGCVALDPELHVFE